MKKAIVLSTIVLLAGCGSNVESSSQTETSKFTTIVSEDDLEVIQDNDSKCKYLIYSDGINGGAAGGITPLLKWDGTPDCK